MKQKGKYLRNYFILCTFVTNSFIQVKLKGTDTMGIFLSEQDFSRLQLSENKPYKDSVRSSNCAMACNLMFLYSQYRLIGIIHQQVINPLTIEDANDKACLLNGLYNTDLNGGDFMTNDLTSDDVIDRYLDYQKMKDKICDGMYLRKDLIDEWCKTIEASPLRFPDFAIQKYFPITGMVKAIYDYITRDASYEQMITAFELSHRIVTKEPLTGADVRRVFGLLQILLEKYCEVLVEHDMARSIETKKDDYV